MAPSIPYRKGQSLRAAPAFLSNGRIAHENDQGDTNLIEYEPEDSDQKQELDGSDGSDDSENRGHNNRERDTGEENQSNNKERLRLDPKKNIPIYQNQKDSQARIEIQLVPTRQKLSTHPQTIISDDRSRGSEFNLSNCKLAALDRSIADRKTRSQELNAESRSNANPKKVSGLTPIPPHMNPRYSAGPGSIQSSPVAKYSRNLAVEIGRMERQERELFGNEPANEALNDQDSSLGDALRTIRKALNIQNESLFTMETLREYASRIRAAEPRVQLIHRVSQSKGKKMYLDPPQWLGGANSSREALAGNLPIINVSSYLSKHPEIICIVYRDYDGSRQGAKDSDEESTDADGRPKHRSEVLQLISEGVTTAVNAFCDYFKFDIGETASTKTTILSSPYLPIFHTRGKELTNFLETLKDMQLQQFQSLLDYIFKEYAAEYELVDILMSQGKITYKYIRYLFTPGGVVVRDNHQDLRGYLCTDWLDEGLPEDRDVWTYKIKVQHWQFDGAFSRKQSTLIFRTNTKGPLRKTIEDIPIRPLEYVNESTKKRLRHRGAWFWKCRIRHMVSYHEENERGFQDSGHARYMIDMKMYQELHKRKEDPAGESKDDLGPKALKKNDPPGGKFIYLMPLTIKGFNLKRKKWLDLEVDKIGPVVWNKEAFQHLVIKEKTKRLIQALISNQIEAENSTDLISGKGNGLIMLLHGGPGTGKTLTAESVAEIAEKPLYPVTCGDIGTEPEEVERYLESVLHIGKTWGCVVLLDEADVFLEQRSLEDLRRNALVSVFLRVLEYYDGILILTSNRVGTFDEAFKSRIQLALHYKNLTEHQRTQIWGNFISRLEEIHEDGIDFAELKDSIEELAKYKLNGREIRNAITTARQYARWERKQPNRQHIQLDFKMMKEVIETAREFDKYIEKLNGGHSYDQLAQDDGLRWGGDT
ncbi:hypothetical protein F5Y09DRAFT_342297 [Xylaria sp. FL1042]|nr:hypothetical protein F5Y09DRAFT_342297 [Xylaria sp. FL1042]